MQIEFLNMLKESRLYMPVSYSENMFECIESAKSRGCDWTYCPNWV